MQLQGKQHNLVGLIMEFFLAAFDTSNGWLKPTKLWLVSKKSSCYTFINSYNVEKYPNVEMSTGTKKFLHRIKEVCEES